MTAEVNGELTRRAAIHAALADPARLSIMDLLLVGDASPSELQVRLSMPSNLMAHHLRVLDNAGLVQRSRSAGDRRRTYLSAVHAALESLAPAPSRTAPRVVFVCTRNSARSQLAVALWRQHSEVPSTSAGTDPAPQIHPGAVAAARRHHLDIRPSTPRLVDDVLRQDDLVVAVCDSAHEELDPELNRVHWSIADPARTGTDEAFDHALTSLTERILRVAPTVRRGRALPHG
jgi:ArsR family transcriptional regulator, arsenate/arsenite/antimonite-responsive transcriptional repressor / arsenate reductase (thioredoxin)